MKLLEGPSIELWEKVARSCKYATFFHTPTWARIIEKSLPKHRIFTRAYSFADGTHAVVPLMMIGDGRNKICRSMAPGVYGGPIADGDLSPERIGEIFSDLCSINARRIDVTGNPLFEFELPEPYVQRDDFTHILRLDAGFEAIWKGFTKGHKSSAKKAERMGVEVGLARSLEDYKEYYRVYEDSLRRWGEKATSRYNFDLFRILFEEDSPDIKLWLARVDGRIIAGALTFYWNAHIVWWHGASLEEYFEYSAANLLSVEAIKDGCMRGYRYYDFNPSGGHEGVASFKKSFGAEKGPIKRWSYRDARPGIIRRIINALQ